MSKKTAKPPAKKSSSKQPPKKPAKTQAKSAAKKKPKQPGRKPGPTLAESADKFALYQRSVQSPTVDIEFFDAEFQKHRGRVPLSVREDFAAPRCSPPSGASPTRAARPSASTSTARRSSGAAPTPSPPRRLTPSSA
ncbi:hypothetical protein [Nannocystis pusilla]|uniref:hypothetical protein n=1 Tax=Nannocystis pusilla TaxID=889268 RepID=UPI003B790D1F